MQNFSSPLCQAFDFPEGDHGVLLIHGFTGSPAHMRMIGEELHSRGFAVRGIRLKGHCETPEAMGRASWKEWWDEACRAAGEMAAAYPHFSVSGLSMGGCIALMLAAEGFPVTACVPIAAPMKTVSWLRYFALPASVFYPTIHKTEEKGRDTLDPAYDIDYDEYPTSCVQQLNVIISKARRRLPGVRCPVMTVQSRSDCVVSADSPDIILRGVSSAEKAQLWLEEAPHVCTISPEHGKITQGMAQFLRKWEGKK